jgi:hypothetical protein
MKSPIQVASSLFLRFLQKNAKNHEKMTIFFLKKSEKKCKKVQKVEKPKILICFSRTFFPRKTGFFHFFTKNAQKNAEKNVKK